MHLAHLVPHAGAALRVEAGGRLVEKQQLRVVDQAEPDVEATLLAARVRAYFAVGGALELEHLDQLAGALASRLDCHSVKAPLEDELGAADDLPVGSTRLADVADSLADLARLGGQVAARDSRGAAARRHQRGEHTKRGRLAGSVRSEEAEDLASADAQVDPDDGFHHALAALEDAAQAARFDYRFRI